MRGRDRLAAWTTGEAVARIKAAQKSAQASWDPLKRLADTYGDVPDDDFHGHLMEVAKSMVRLDHYFVYLLAEARRRGIG
ncbi:hypothetical protein [Candidatus Frankia alpina]|uniref:Uncharacterized protein n=1 Tax=Candidatus Frankia alpina TaxID=2699483 RepID=A0A4S5CH75_9ACTN|nr:hypothetical protein [Candidatus Frankia alpina]THJ42568.1 hypothetical protein E7Y31_20425 [Candidatus Frankia alpina]